MIPRRRVIRWINRHGFATRKGVILQWLFIGHLLTLGYKSTLLYTLIPIRYQNTIDTLDDMAKSGLLLTVPRATTLHKLLATDPRTHMRKIYMRSFFVQVLANLNSTAVERIVNM